MSIISLSTYTDMSGAATPSSGILIGLDTLDGKLKQKDSLGNVTEIGSGGGGSAGTSGTSGTSGSSGTSGINGTIGNDGANSFRWYYGDSALSGEFNLTNPDFSETLNRVNLNYNNDLSVDVSNWLLTLNNFLIINPGQAYLQITRIDDASEYVIYQVDSGFDFSTYWSFNCQKVSSNGVATTGREYTINWVIMGQQGTNGTSGTSGINGTYGTSGTSGSSGTSGINGSVGTTGTSGTSGSSGTSGTSGSSGTSGLSNGIIVKPAINTLPFTLTIATAPNIYPEYYPVDTSTYEITVILPDASTISDGKIIYIKDEHGSASSYPITINQHLADTIDGSVGTYVINTDYGVLTLIKNGGGAWFTL